jgi:hypothetical protein
MKHVALVLLGLVVVIAVARHQGDELRLVTRAVVLVAREATLRHSCEVRD